MGGSLHKKNRQYMNSQELGRLDFTIIKSHADRIRLYKTIPLHVLSTIILPNIGLSTINDPRFEEYDERCELVTLDHILWQHTISAVAQYGVQILPYRHDGTLIQNNIRRREDGSLIENSVQGYMKLVRSEDTWYQHPELIGEVADLSELPPKCAAIRIIVFDYVSHCIIKKYDINLASLIINNDMGNPVEIEKKSKLDSNEYPTEYFTFKLKFVLRENEIAEIFEADSEKVRIVDSGDVSY
jgi:hypothetical protein